ncbi:MAG: ABC transporter substrate-binding protein, partial [Pseudomonadota bacterium]
EVPGDNGQELNLEQLPHQRPDLARALIMNTRRTPFDHLRVRQALDLAFDFEWLNRAVFRGAYKRIESYFPNSELAPSGEPSSAELALLKPFRDELPEAVFGESYAAPQTDGSGMAGRRGNLRKAIGLLQQAGWRLSSGKLLNEAGEQMRLEILIQTGAEEGIVLEWTRTLARLGIVADIRSVDATQFRQRLNAFDYDVVLYRWINTLSPGLEQRLYWGSEFADQEGSRNYAGVRSEAVDALASGIANATSRDDLIAHAHALDRVLTHGHYAVLLYHLGHDLVAYWDPVRRPTRTPLYGLVIEAWWADQAAQ